MAELRIKEICKSKNITQQDLANRLHISQAGISKMLNRNLTIQSLEEIANALDVSITELFEEKCIHETLSKDFVCPKCGAKLHVVADN